MNTQTRDSNFNSTDDRKRRILIVEDDAIHRQLIQTQLKGRYQLETVPDREAAEHSFRQSNDLIVLDLRLPYRIGQSASMEEGFKILVRLQESQNSESLKIVTVSGGLMTDERKDRLKDLGVEAIFEKPFSLTELQDKIHSMLNSPIDESKTC